MLKIEKKIKFHCVYQNKVHFYPIMLVILKQPSLSGSVPSARYIPRRFASRYISTTIHLPVGGYLLITQPSFPLGR